MKRESSLELVRAIVDRQYPRGPDHQAVESVAGETATTVLGHDRLSIIDLSPDAHQPMWDADRRYGVVFNGEVYNYLELRAELAALGHVFRTRSDTEVLIEAFKEWGTDAIPRFNGMFAFALLDTAADRLWLARDRFGVKPLYYGQEGDSLYFASTCETLAQRLRLRANVEYVARGLRYWIYEDSSDIAPFCGLKALRPGHLLEVSRAEDGGLRTRLCRYYSLEERVEVLRDELAGRSFEELAALVADRLASAVDLRLRADVPVGISLSGGLDSCLITALLADRHADVIGFTFGHPDDHGTEGPLVEQFRRQTGIQVEYVRPDRREIVDSFQDTLAAQGAPFPGGSVMAQFLVYRAARARGVKVLLGGQGGDEAFMGYRKFLVFQLRQMLRQSHRREALRYMLGLFLLLLAELPQIGEYWRQRYRYDGRYSRDSVVRMPELETPLELDYVPTEPLWRRQARDVTDLSLPTLLRYEDRNSMANSIESRLPFMDYRVMELAVALPEVLKVRSGYGKWVLRELMRGRMPEAIRAARYKRGFDVNQAAWIEQGLGDCLRAALAERRDRLEPWLHPGTRIEEAFSNGRLQRHMPALPEAVALIWLGDHV